MLPEQNRCSSLGEVPSMLVPQLENLVWDRAGCPPVFSRVRRMERKIHRVSWWGVTTPETTRTSQHHPAGQRRPRTGGKSPSRRRAGAGLLSGAPVRGNLVQCLELGRWLVGERETHSFHVCTISRPRLRKFIYVPCKHAASVRLQKLDQWLFLYGPGTHVGE